MFTPQVLKSFLFLLFISSLSFCEYVIIRKDNPSKDEIQYLYTKGYEIAASKVDDFVDIIIPENELSKSDFIGFKIIDRESKINSRAFFKSDDRQTELKYQTYSEYVENLNILAEQYSDIIKVYNIGMSQGKKQGLEDYDHDIWLIKVSDNVNTEEAEPGFLFVGEHHARETQSFAVTYNFLIHLLTNYQTDEKIKSYVDNNQIYFIPLLNPDGYMITKTINGMWRKNANLNGTALSQYSFNTGSYSGVDLNRNYEYMWGEGNSSSAKNNDTYMGAASFSESETYTLDSVVSSLNIQGAITFHSYAEAILIPYCYSNSAKPKDYSEIQSLASLMAEDLQKESGGPYDVGTPEDVLGYGVGGVMTDQMYSQYGIFTYCVELWTEFYTKVEDLPPLATKCIGASEKIIERATYKTLRGIVTLDGKPVKAKIEISGIDDQNGDRADYYSFEKTGLYVRFLPIGTYTLTVTLDSDPTVSKTIENIEIKENEITNVDVAFSKTENVKGEAIANFNMDIISLSRNCLTVSIPVGGKYEFSVYMLNGKTVAKGSNILDKGKTGINIKSDLLSSQVVIVKIKGKKEQLIKEIIVK